MTTRPLVVKILTEKKLQKEISSLSFKRTGSQCAPIFNPIGHEADKVRHFINDTIKVHMCLPTKTGSSNWLSLIKKASGIREPHLEEGDLEMFIKLKILTIFLKKNPKNSSNIP